MNTYRNMLFSKRYKDILESKDGASFLDSGLAQIRDQLVEILKDFYCPVLIQPDRYSNWTVNSSCLDIVLKRLRLADLHGIGDCDRSDDILNRCSITEVFDVIESLYEELPDSNEKSDFSSEINKLFCDNGRPWLLCKGKLVKIDSQQFECDLKNRTQHELEAFANAYPAFKNAHDELLQAFHYFSKRDYSTAVSYAEKSYESIMKVISNVGNGSANNLTENMKTFVTLPDTMQFAGFKNNVLMALPFIRNNSCTDHGKGAMDAVVTKELANLSLNLACSLINFLVQSYKIIQ